MRKAVAIPSVLAMMAGAAFWTARQFAASTAQPLHLSGDLGYAVSPYVYFALLAVLSAHRGFSPAYFKSLFVTSLLLLLATLLGYADIDSSSTGGLVFVFLPGLLCIGGVFFLLISVVFRSFRSGGTPRS